jgi:hypothetical protein
MHEKRVLTVKAVQMKLWETIGYRVQSVNMLKMSRHSTFVGRKYAIPVTDTCSLKKQDLSEALIQAIAIFRKDGRMILYSDETYI